jgi:hypothetical protein
LTLIWAHSLDWTFSIASDDAKGSSPGDTGADKDVMDALTYNAQVYRSEHLRLIMKD